MARDCESILHDFCMNILITNKDLREKRLNQSDDPRQVGTVRSSEHVIV